MNVKCVSMKGNLNSTQQNYWHDVRYVSQTGRNVEGFCSISWYFWCCFGHRWHNLFLYSETCCWCINSPCNRLRAAWFMFFRHYAADLAPIEKHGFGSRGIYTLFWIHGRMMDPTCLKNTINSELVKSIKSYWHYFMLKINGCYWFEYLYFYSQKALPSSKDFQENLWLWLYISTVTQGSWSLLLYWLHDNSKCHLLHSFTWCFD